MVLDGAAESVIDKLTQDEEEIIENGCLMNVCCRGGLYSQDELMMRRCIVETHPIKKLPIELIVSNYPFVEYINKQKLQPISSVILRYVTGFQQKFSTYVAEVLELNSPYVS